MKMLKIASSLLPCLLLCGCIIWPFGERFYFSNMEHIPVSLENKGKFVSVVYDACKCSHTLIHKNEKVLFNAAETLKQSIDGKSYEWLENYFSKFESGKNGGIEITLFESTTMEHSSIPVRGCMHPGESKKNKTIKISEDIFFAQDELSLIAYRDKKSARFITLEKSGTEYVVLGEVECIVEGEKALFTCFGKNNLGFFRSSEYFLAPKASLRYLDHSSNFYKFEKSHLNGNMFPEITYLVLDDKTLADAEKITESEARQFKNAAKQKK